MTQRRTPPSRSTFRVLLVLALAAGLPACSSCGQDDADSDEAGASQLEGSAEGASGQEAHEGSADPSQAQQAAPGEEPVLVVNGETVLTKSALDEQVQEITERYERIPDRPPTTARWRNQRRQRIVQQELQDHLTELHVAEQSITVTDEEVEEVLTEELRHIFTEDRLFERFLETQGMTREEYYDEKRQEIATDRVLSRRGEIEPTEEELREFYEQNRDRWREDDRVRAHTITVRLRRNASEEAEQAARERIEEIRSRITGGESFDEVARDVSESADRRRGGDMGWIIRGRRTQLAEDGVEDLLFRIPIGRVSEPVRTQLGWQIFRVTDRRDAGIRQFDEVKDIIYEPLRRRKRDQLRVELVNEIQNRDDILIRRIEENFGLEDETPSQPLTPTPTPGQSDDDGSEGEGGE